MVSTYGGLNKAHAYRGEDFLYGAAKTPSSQIAMYDYGEGSLDFGRSLRMMIHEIVKKINIYSISHFS